MLLTAKLVAIVCTTLQGRLELLKKRFPRPYSTNPHPVLNDDFAIYSQCSSLFMSDFFIVPLFSFSSAASILPEVALCAPALCLGHQGKPRVLSGTVDRHWQRSIAPLLSLPFPVP